MRIMLIFLLLSTSGPALAVDTSACPTNIELSYEDLIPVSEERLERLRRNSNPEVYRLASQSRSAIIASAPEDLQGMVYEFSRAQRGKCFYTDGGNGGGTEIYTRNGADLMRVTLPFPGLQVHTTHTLSKVDASGVTVEHRPVTPLFVRVGASSYQIGWAYGLNF